MDWSAIASIIAVVLAAIFAGIGYLVRLNRKRKRVLCVALYHLLEIWHQIRMPASINPKSFVDMYLSEIRRQAPELEITETDREIAHIFLTQLWPEMLSVADNNGEYSIEEDFNHAIEELAEFDPILAFELSSNQALKSVMSLLARYMKELEEAAKNEDSEGGIEDIELMFNNMKSFLHGDLIKGLEKDLIWLSFQISTLALIRTVRKIYKKRSAGTADAEKMIKALVSQAIVPSIKSTNKSNRAGQTSAA